MYLCFHFFRFVTFLTFCTTALPLRSRRSLFLRRKWRSWLLWWQSFSLQFLQERHSLVCSEKRSGCRHAAISHTEILYQNATAQTVFPGLTSPPPGVGSTSNCEKKEANAPLSLIKPRIIKAMPKSAPQMPSTMPAIERPSK